MDSRAQRYRVAIFGGGRVGTAMSLEMPEVPVVRRGQDLECDVALICWPAQGIADFAKTHPLASRARKVALCNGCWAVEDGADEHGCCYVRAVNVGDRSQEGRNGWRVESPWIARILRELGLGVICSRRDHSQHLWGKALYILPLALACSELHVTAKEAIKTKSWQEWFDVVLECGRTATNSDLDAQIARARFLCLRSLVGWTPSPSREEIAYFLDHLSLSLQYGAAQ